MSQKKLLHTPDGVRDLYYNEYAKKAAVSHHIHQVLKLYGYRDIQTPTFEFFDIFSQDKGSVAAKDMYKFVDRDGNTLVLRPDITPSIARCTSKYFMEEDMPVRLSYCGEVFQNNSGYRGQLKEQTQIGGELVGDATSDADAEMIAMLIDCLLAAGLQNFQVEVGHIGFYNGLIEESGLEEDEQEQVRDLIANKNYFALEELLREKEMSQEVKEAFIQLPKLFGTISQIQAAKDITSNPVCLQAIAYLEELYEIVQQYGLEEYITFDLGMLGNFKYYTGIIFNAYTYDTGAPIAAGGRYDRLIRQYGKDTASIGFGIRLDSLLTAMNRQKIAIDTDIIGTILLYDRKQKALAIRLAGKLRKDGSSLQMMKKYYEKSIEDYIAYANRSFIGEILYIDETGETVQVIQCGSGASRVEKIDAYLK
ncbi:MAG: ATP phosphoribosyltransferase regulatory subunit [Lachnospiraceae bacterium]|nr:ATP phosphoribosyltransferase regulatory subunit [Lachnospiraceae bacterium]